MLPQSDIFRVRRGVLPRCTSAARSNDAKRGKVLPHLLRLAKLARFPVLLSLCLNASLWAQQNRIAYVGPESTGTTSTIRLLNPGISDNPISFSSVVDLVFPRWSRDGRFIAAQGVPVMSPPTSAPNMFRFDPTGGNLAQVSNYQLTTGAIPIAFFNAFSPDAQKLALSVLSETNTPTVGIQIYQTLQTYSLTGTLPDPQPVNILTGCVVDATGSCIQVLGAPELPTTGDLFGVDWSPNSNSLLLPLATYYPCPNVLAPFAIVTEIWSVNIDASPPTKTKVSNTDISPDCPPNIVTPAIANVLPAFSPDGTQIAFARWIRALGGPVTTTSIRTMNADGTNEREVASFNNVQTWGLSWSADHHQLVFDQGAPDQLIPNLLNPGSKGLWVINVDACLLPGPADPPCGSGLAQITPQGQIAVAPSWSWATPPMDFTASGPSGAVTVTAGQPASFTITLAPSAGGFPNAITFSASGLPPAAAASFNPPSVTPGNAPATTTMTITTMARSAAPLGALPNMRPMQPLNVLWLVAAALALIGLVQLRRGALRRCYATCLPFAFLVLSTVLIVSCGGGGGGSSSSVASPHLQGTPAGNYTITVTATSAQTSHTTTVTLTVN